MKVMLENQGIVGIRWWENSFLCGAVHHLACRSLVPWAGIEPSPPAVEAQSPNHWTTREVPTGSCFRQDGQKSSCLYVNIWARIWKKWGRKPCEYLKKEYSSPECTKVLREKSGRNSSDSHSVMHDFDPMDCNLPGSSVHGVFQQEYWSGLPFPSPGGLSDPGIEPRSHALWADSLLSLVVWATNGNGWQGDWGEMIWGWRGELGWLPCPWYPGNCISCGWDGKNVSSG